MNKGLEAFKRIGNAVDHADDMAMSYFEEGDFDIVEKQLQALEIIKEKRVNVGKFIDMLEDWKAITYEDWLNYKEENGYYLQDELNELEFGIITKEEYDLLKEVLL